MRPVEKISELASIYVAELGVWLPALHDSDSPRRQAHRELELAVSDARRDLIGARALYRGCRYQSERALAHCRDSAELAGRLLALVNEPSQAEKSAIHLVNAQYADSVASWTASDGIENAEHLIAGLPNGISRACLQKVRDLVAAQFQRLGLNKRDRAVALLAGLDSRTAARELATLASLHSKAATAVDECLRLLGHEMATVEFANKVLSERVSAATA